MKLKNEIDKIRKWEKKTKRKDLKMKQKNTHMIFTNMKQKVLLVIIFIPAKLVKLKLKWIEAIYQKY